jgi:hypothetical protein
VDVGDSEDKKVMAKRFTATEKWDDPWFFKLNDKIKLAWIFLLDKCDHAGIWNVNPSLIDFHLGFVPEVQDFGGRVIELTHEKWFIPKFVLFQYGELNQENRAHLSVISRLEKEGAYKLLTSPSQGAKDKDKEKESLSLKTSVLNAEKREEREPRGFADFWLAYPKKRSRGAALKAWRRLNPSSEQVGRILAAISRAKMSTDWVKDSGQYIPHPATWLNAEGWLDEVASSGERAVVG